MAQNDLNELQEKIQFYETILDNIHNGVMITDPDGGDRRPRRSGLRSYL